jgi:ComF family protein
MAGEYIEVVPVPAWPSQCALCHGWGWSRLCGACIERHAAPATRCPRCALRLAAHAGPCGRCLVHPPSFDAALAAFDYAPPWDGLIARYKFHEALDLRDALAECLLTAWAQAGRPAPGLLLPVPLGEARLRERGYNQAWELVRWLARRLAAPASAGLLLRLRETTQQMDLPLGDRAANVQGAFAVDPLLRAQLQGQDVTVVDDVMTTGATFEEIARVLRAAGARRIQVWALARTPAPGD